jgi:hypothetical protein
VTKKVHAWPKVQALLTVLQLLSGQDAPAPTSTPEDGNVTLGITVDQFDALPIEERIRILSSPLPLTGGN